MKIHYTHALLFWMLSTYLLGCQGLSRSFNMDMDEGNQVPSYVSTVGEDTEVQGVQEKEIVLDSILQEKGIVLPQDLVSSIIDYAGVSISAVEGAYGDCVFGPSAWEAYFGEVGEVPNLPYNIEEILESSCPFWKDKQVKETHWLVLIPTEVGGKGLSLDLLGELIEKPRSGNATKYGYYNSYTKAQHGGTQVAKSYWVLLTRDVLEGTRNENYKDQCAVIEKYADYQLPGLLEAAVGILGHYVRTGERLYSDAPWTYTRCREVVTLDSGGKYQACVGGFSSGGLHVATTTLTAATTVLLACGSSVLDTWLLGIGDCGLELVNLELECGGSAASSAGQA